MGGLTLVLTWLMAGRGGWHPWGGGVKHRSHQAWIKVCSNTTSSLFQRQRSKIGLTSPLASAVPCNKGAPDALGLNEPPEEGGSSAGRIRDLSSSVRLMNLWQTRTFWMKGQIARRSFPHFFLTSQLSESTCWCYTHPPTNVCHQNQFFSLLGRGQKLNGPQNASHKTKKRKLKTLHLWVK